MSEVGQASSFVLRHRDALVAAASLGPLLDVACGRGRNALALAGPGRRVIGLDRSAESLQALAGRVRAERLPIDIVRTDLEAGAGLPLRQGCCGAVIVVRYLHRPLSAELAGLLAPGGLLLYETFTRDQGTVPYGPENPAFLLDPGELTLLFPSLVPLEAEEGWFDDGRRWALSRLLARKVR